MDHRLTLQQMLDLVLENSDAGAMEKLAEEACESKERKMSKEEAERQAAKEESQQGGGTTETYREKAAEERVVKLASAVEQIVSALLQGDTVSPVGRVVVAQDSATRDTGPGRGPGAVSTNLDSPASGEQSEDSGEAHTKIPAKPSMEAGANPKGPPNAMQTNDDSPVRGEMPAKGVMKQSSIRNYLTGLLAKQAGGGDEGDDARISAPKSSALPEDAAPPKYPAEVTAQERHISSNETPAKMTKAEAKAVPKKRLREVLSEPAQSAATDKVLDAALGSKTVDQAGAKIAAARKLKIAAARSLLAKIASEGCTCSPQKGSCEFCKIASWQQKRSEKGSEKQGQLTPPPMATPAPSTGMAGGTPAPQM